MSIDEIIMMPEGDASVIKRTDGCAVVDYGDYVIKIKEIDLNDPLTCFDNFIAQAFAAEYQHMGIEWELSNVSLDGKTFRVEKRQKLELLDSGKMSFEEAVKNSSVLRRRVEKRLEFPRLFAQIHSFKDFEHFNKLVMAREHASDLSDFAIFDGRVVILGQSKWFLGLLNRDSRWGTVETQRVLPVETNYGKFYFAAQNLFLKKNAVGSALQDSLKWWLFSSDVGNLESFRLKMYDELKEMATNNLKVLATKKPFVIKSKKDFGNVSSEMKKMGLLGSNFGDELKTQKVS